MMVNAGMGNAGRAYFGRRYMLSASHRLHCGSLTPDENFAAYGKCNNPHGHGHNYTIEVLVGGEVERETGMVINLIDLDEAVKTRVIDRFDHTNLNLDPLFVSLVPTTENLCGAIYGLLKTSLRAGSLEYVRVEETENNFFQCYDAPAVAEASQALAQAS
jgi:6-pyruvoyltetrahydropterin/6-carboxytetrahydropterin synthase